MKKDSGKGEIGERDDAFMLDLYYTRVMTIAQIAQRHFPSYVSARQRLYEVGWMGFIENNVYSRKDGLNVWMLTKRGFRRQAEDVGSEGERYRDWPTARNIRHYIETNDFYVLATAELDAIVGEQPAWRWRDEARSSHHWKIGAQGGTHRPDAEIEMFNHLYFLERQTERSKESPSYFEDRMKDYQGYVRYAQAERGVEKCHVIWACDTERDINHALEAASPYPVHTVADTPLKVCRYLAKQATELETASTR